MQHIWCVGCGIMSVCACFVGFLDLFLSLLMGWMIYIIGFPSRLQGEFQMLVPSHGKAVHDYVQWIFPTDEASMFNSAAPLLSPELQAICRHDEKIQDNFATWFRRSVRYFCANVGCQCSCHKRHIRSLFVVFYSLKTMFAYCFCWG